MNTSFISPSGSSGAPKLARQLVAAATALFIFFATLVFNMLLPPALLNPAWVLRFATGLIGIAYLPLLGLVLVHLGAYVNPTPTLDDFRRSLCKWAVIASLGFLMLLPLQVWASWQLINQNFSALDSGKPTSDDPLLPLEKAINAAQDAATLQTQLQILRGPAISPQDLRRPLPELKQLLLRSLQQARANLQRKARSSPDPRVWVLIQDVIRFSIGSVAYATGFAAFARRPRSPITLLEEWKAALPQRGPRNRLTPM